MKTQWVSVHCLLIILRVSGSVGTSPCHRDVQFRSSNFRLKSAKHRPLIPLYAAHLILCAGHCSSDDECVGIRADKNDMECSTLAKIPAGEGFIWKRQSEIWTEPNYKATEKTSDLRIKSKASCLLSASVLPGQWTRKGGLIKSKLRWYDRNTGKTKLWRASADAVGDPSQWVTGSVLASSTTVILTLAMPPTLCSGRLFSEFTCMPVPPNWGTLGGMQLHQDYLYVSAGTSVYRLQIKRHKLSHPELFMKVLDTPSDIAIDALNGKRVMFWSEKRFGRIGRAQMYRKEVKRMDPLYICSNHFTFTIDSTNHVIYLLTNDKTLMLMRDIHAVKTTPVPTILTVVPHPWPFTKLQILINGVYLFWPKKRDIAIFYVTTKKVLYSSLRNVQIARRPHVVAVVRE